MLKGRHFFVESDSVLIFNEVDVTILLMLNNRQFFIWILYRLH